MTTETSTQQRPWTDVAQTAKAGRVAQFAAMSLAHSLAWDRALEESCWHDPLEGVASGDLMPAYRQHSAPSAAAFAAAAVFAGWDAAGIESFLADDMERATAQIVRWLTAAGVDPDEIAPAT